jgi:hypothetical protein
MMLLLHLQNILMLLLLLRNRPCYLLPSVVLINKHISWSWHTYTTARHRHKLLLLLRLPRTLRYRRLLHQDFVLIL